MLKTVVSIRLCLALANTIGELVEPGHVSLLLHASLEGCAAFVLSSSLHGIAHRLWCMFCRQARWASVSAALQPQQLLLTLLDQ